MRPVEPPRTVVVLAKAPVPGRVKTRLAPWVGPQGAAEAAAAALADTLDAVAALPVRRVLVLDGEPGPWVPSDVDVLPQGSGGLDRRLAAAFDDVFQRYPGPVLLVGMDTPQLAPVLAAVDLHGHDAVLGPADDGGFWAIGLRSGDRALLEELFVGVPMSEPTTGAAQLARLRAHGLDVGLLPSLRDIDDPQDARTVAAQAPTSRFARCWQELDTEHDAGRATTRDPTLDPTTRARRAS